MRVGSGEWRDTLLHELETAFSPQQLKDAKALIEDESRFIGKHGVDYVFVSKPHGPPEAQTVDAYITSVYRDTCTCPAQKYDQTCYHRAASIGLTVWGGEASDEL